MAKPSRPAKPRPEDHPLYPIFVAAIEQAMFGKGERHGGCATPFLEQRWNRLATHPAGLSFQAMKKLEEALDKPTFEAFEREFHGALVYMGMTYLKVKQTFNDR